jgi:hypothetical protein
MVDMAPDMRAVACLLALLAAAPMAFERAPTAKLRAPVASPRVDVPGASVATDTIGLGSAGVIVGRPETPPACAACPQAQLEHAWASEGYSQAVAQRILLRHIGRLSLCTTGLLADDASLGVVNAGLEVGATGSVSSVQTSGTGAARGRVARCFARVLRRLVFPASDSGSNVQIHARLRLRP